MNNFIEKFNFKRIFTYTEFLNYSKTKIETKSEESVDGKEKIYLEYSKINLVRSIRIQKSYKLNPELKQYFEKIEEKQIWLVITEDWCGDSAQNLPYIYKYVENHPKIDFKIVLRDENVDILDQFYENGAGRGIPKIIIFTSSGKVLFKWGPRPAFAQNFVKELKQNGIESKTVNEKLHLWYARNKGKELEKELKNMLIKISSV